jgi:dihydroorotate dehydrogenase (NAD+) catalytic subunit
MNESVPKDRCSMQAESSGNLTVSIGAVTLSNPVGVASGTFGYGSEYEELIDLSAVGALFAKSVTLEPRAGNDIPRLIETPSGLLNSIGLANVGIERYVAEKLPGFAALPCPVFANIAGGTASEYERLVEILDSHAGIAGYEVNLSCPNVSHGLAFGTDPAEVESLTAALRKRTARTLVVKLTPNVTDITEIALAAEAGGADAITCINTVVGMVIDTRSMRPVLPAGTGGLSGPAIRPVGVAAVYRVARRVSIPIIGVGGIMTADDAIQYLLAGARAVQIGTANFVDPRTVARVVAGIAEYAAAHEIRNIDEFRGLLSR